MRGRRPDVKIVNKVDPLDTCPAAPDWLPAAARAEWMRVAPLLHSRRLLTEDALATLESYCVAVAAVRDLESILARDGRVVEGRFGPETHPAHTAQMQAMVQARLLAAELGLTPARRKGKQQEAAGDDWDDVLA